MQPPDFLCIGDFPGKARYALPNWDKKAANYLGLLKLTCVLL